MPAGSLCMPAGSLCMSAGSLCMSAGYILIALEGHGYSNIGALWWTLNSFLPFASPQCNPICKHLMIINDKAIA